MASNNGFTRATFTNGVANCTNRNQTVHIEQQIVSFDDSGSEDEMVVLEKGKKIINHDDDSNTNRSQTLYSETFERSPSSGVRLNIQGSGRVANRGGNMNIQNQVISFNDDGFGMTVHDDSDSEENLDGDSSKHTGKDQGIDDEVFTPAQLCSLAPEPSTLEPEKIAPSADLHKNRDQSASQTFTTINFGSNIRIGRQVNHFANPNVAESDEEKDDDGRDENAEVVAYGPTSTDGQRRVNTTRRNRRVICINHTSQCKHP